MRVDLIDLLAFVGALTAAAISLPQFRLVVRTKDTHGLALATWVIGLGTGIGWCAHGIKLVEINMIWPNVWSVIVAVTILYYLRRNKRFHSLTVPLLGLAIAAALIGLDVVVGSAVFGIAVVIPQGFGMARQGVALMYAPQVSGVSISSWVLQVVNQAIWLVWALLVSEWGTLICASISLVVAGFVLAWRLARAAGVGPIRRRGHGDDDRLSHRIGSVEDSAPITDQG